MFKLILLSCVFISQSLMIFAHPDCKDLDNGQISNNPIYTESSCSNECLICQSKTCENINGSECPVSACSNQCKYLYISRLKISEEIIRA